MRSGDEYLYAGYNDERPRGSFATVKRVARWIIPMITCASIYLLVTRRSTLYPATSKTRSPVGSTLWVGRRV